MLDDCVLGYFCEHSHLMPTVALLLSLSEQPMLFMHERSAPSACGHLGLFFAAQADGQQNCLTSLEKHIGTTSRVTPKSSTAIMNGVVMFHLVRLAFRRKTRVANFISLTEPLRECHARCDILWPCTARRLGNGTHSGSQYRGMRSPVPRFVLDCPRCSALIRGLEISVPAQIRPRLLIEDLGGTWSRPYANLPSSLCERSATVRSNVEPLRPLGTHSNGIKMKYPKLPNTY